MQNLQEKKPDAKKKEPRCPFDKDLKCEDCRLFIHVSKDVGKVCSINLTAMRSD